jgi:Ca2+-binding EF-hand superfamily protein
MNYEDYINSLDPDEKIKIKEIFELFDKNLDGGIDIKELKFILNSLDIFPNHEELTAMMIEADVSKKGFISKSF